MKKFLMILLAVMLLSSSTVMAGEGNGITFSDDSSDFVLLTEAVPDAILEIRYYSTYNFVGDRIDGYEEPLAFLTKEAASALKEVSDDLIEKGYRLKIYDAYRPQMAVTNFVEWAKDMDDTRMKAYFYPELDKDVLFPQGYIAEQSGHSRGSTVDLTLFDMTTEKEVDMGGTFDYFGELSHPDYTGITEEQYANRMILREAMMAHGFKPLPEEWWHFTLENEPYPNTYFTFPINSDSISQEGMSEDADGAAETSETAAEAGMDEAAIVEGEVAQEQAAAAADAIAADAVAADAAAADAIAEAAMAEEYVQDVQYVMYLGTNDKDTNEPVFTPEEAKMAAKEILVRHFGGYTLQEAEGGWVGEDGTLYQEYTLVIYLSDTDLDSVHQAADEMIQVFHQSSVLIHVNESTTEFYFGA